jgi:acetyl-CoA synthetase
MGSVGEPISPGSWKWYHSVCGDGKAPICDTWWMSETGGILLAALPGAHATKPGSCTLPFFGIQPAIISVETGEELKGNDVTGLMCLKLDTGAWPGISRTVLGNHTRYLETYFKPYPGYFFTGDGATRDKDGYYWIRGRVDDVVNVSGHRISSAEVEAALVTHSAIAEAAAIGVKDDLTGQALTVFTVPKAADGIASKDLPAKLIAHVRSALGAFSAPKTIFLVPDLPKTRSGKIMRRILRKIADGEVVSVADIPALGDLSTLSEPGVVPVIIDLVHGKRGNPKL